MVDEGHEHPPFRVGKTAMRRLRGSDKRLLIAQVLPGGVLIPLPSIHFPQRMNGPAPYREKVL